MKNENTPNFDEKIEVMGNNSTILKNPMSDIVRKLKETPSKINRNLLLDLIRIIAPITTYKLHKITGFAYSSIRDAIREMEFAGLVKYKVILGDNNRTQKLICMEEGNMQLNQEEKNG